MSKQGIGDGQREVVTELPPLLSSFTSALENSGVLSIFGLTVGKGTGTSARVSSERSNAATDAVGDHVVRDDAAELKATSDSNLVDGPSGRPKIERVLSDTGSEEDMPGLERLECSSLTAYSNKQSAPHKIWVAGNAGAEANTRRSSAGITVASSQVDIRWSNSEPLGQTGRFSGASGTLKTKKPFVDEVPGLPGGERETFSTGAVGGFERWERSIRNRSVSSLPPGMSPAFSVFTSSTGSADSEPQVWQPTRLNEDLLETPEWASASVSETTTPTPGLERPIPEPLDLSAVAGPTPCTCKKKSLPDPKPVVLKSAALDHLRRLGGPSSSVSSFESRGSAAGMILAGRVRGAGRDRSGATGYAEAGVKGSKRTGPGAPGREVAGDALRRGTAAASAPVAGQTFLVKAFLSLDGDDDDDAPPLPSPMLTGHLRRSLNIIPNLQQQPERHPPPQWKLQENHQQPQRKPQEHPNHDQQQLGELKEHRRGGRGPSKGRGHRPPTWSEDDEGAPPLPPSPRTAAAVPPRADKVKLRLVRRSQSRSPGGNNYTLEGVSPMGTPLSVASVSTDAIAISGAGRVARNGGRFGNTYDAERDVNTLRRAAAAVAATTTTAKDLMKGEALDEPQLLMPGMLFDAFQRFTVSPIVLPLANASACAGAGSGFADVVVGRENLGHVGGKYSRATTISKAPEESSERSHGFPSEKGSENASVLGPARLNPDFKHPSNSASSAGPRASSTPADGPSLTYTYVPGLVHQPSYLYQSQENPVVNVNPEATDDVDGPAFLDERQPPLRLSSSKRLTSFDTNDDDGNDVGESEWSARGGRAGVRSSGSATGMPRRPTLIDLLSTFESHRSPSPDEEETRRRLLQESTVQVQSRYEDSGHHKPAPHSERESVDHGASARDGARVGARADSEERVRHAGSRRRSSDSPRTARGRVREDRISQRRSRSSGSHIGGSRRLNSGMELAGLSSDEIRSLSRGRRPRSLRSRSLRSRSSEEGISGDSYGDSVADRRWRHYESRTHSRPRSSDESSRFSDISTPSSSSDIRMPGDPTTERRASSVGASIQRKEHKRRSYTGGGESDADHQSTRSCSARTSSREEVNGSGKPDVEEEEGYASATAPSAPPAAYVSETSGEGHDPEAYFTPAIGQAYASETPDSKTSRKASQSRFKSIRKKSSANSAYASSARRTPIVRKKGRLKSILGRFFRGQEERVGDYSDKDYSHCEDGGGFSYDDDHEEDYDYDQGHHDNNASRSLQKRDDYSPAQLAPKAGQRAHVIATPLRSGRNSSFRGYSRSESQELANASVQSGGRPIPLFSGWLVKMFGRGSPKKIGKASPRHQQQQQQQQQQQLKQHGGMQRTVPFHSSLGSGGGVGVGGGDGTALASSSAGSSSARVGGIDGGGSGAVAFSLDSVDERDQLRLRHMSLSVLPSFPRKPPLDEDRTIGSGPAGMAYSRFYDEPPSMVDSREELDRRAQSLREERVYVGGTRVQHLLRTSLFVKTRQSMLSQKPRTDMLPS